MPFTFKKESFRYSTPFHFSFFPCTISLSFWYSALKWFPFDCCFFHSFFISSFHNAIRFLFIRVYCPIAKWSWLIEMGTTQFSIVATMKHHPIIHHVLLHVYTGCRFTLRLPDLMPLDFVNTAPSFKSIYRSFVSHFALCFAIPLNFLKFSKKKLLVTNVCELGAKNRIILNTNNSIVFDWSFHLRREHLK